MKALFQTLFIVFFTLSVCAGTAFAQAEEPTDESFAISILQTPEHPQPGEVVSFELVSFQTNVDKGNIGWFLDGELQTQGIGKKKFSFTISEAGRLYTVEVVYQDAKVGTITKKVTLNPADVDILWEADSYTPPFYRGKALVASESKIRFSAVPHIVTSDGTKISPSNLVYKWERNNKAVLEQSGYGFTSVDVETRYTANVLSAEVSISSLEENINAYQWINVTPVKPDVVFYEKKPLEGVRYEKALSSNHRMTGAEMTLVAEPYFFSFPHRDNNAGTFEWFLNNKSTVSAGNKSQLIVRAPEGVRGQAQIRLEVRNPNSILQFMVKPFALLFGN